MNFNLDKRMKIIIGGSVAGLFIIVFFSILIFGGDKKQNQPTAAQLPQNSQAQTPIQQPAQQPVQQATQQQQPAAQQPTNDSKKTDTQTAPAAAVLQNAPYTRVFFNGQTHVVNAGDLVVDSQGNLLIKASYLGAGLNMPVSWEKDTVWVGLQPVKGTDEVAQFLSDMDYLRFYIPDGKQMSKLEMNKDKWSKESYFQIAGTQYQKGLGFNLSYSWGDSTPVSMDYNTAGNYKAFKAVIGVDDQFKNANSSYIVRIYGDNDKKFESKPFRGGDFAIPVEVDITGVIRLTVEVTRVSKENQNNDTKVVIADARLTK